MAAMRAMRKLQKVRLTNTQQIGLCAVQRVQVLVHYTWTFIHVPDFPFTVSVLSIVIFLRCHGNSQVRDG